MAGGIGNLVARVLTMANKLSLKFQDSSFQQVSNSKLQEILEEAQKNTAQSLEEFRFNEALTAIWEVVHFCDKYIDEKKPWSSANDQEMKEKTAVIKDLLSAIAEIAVLLQPFLPETTEKIQNQLKTQQSQILFPRLP